MDVLSMIQWSTSDGKKTERKMSLPGCVCVWGGGFQCIIH